MENITFFCKRITSRKHLFTFHTLASTPSGFTSLSFPLHCAAKHCVSANVVISLPPKTLGAFAEDALSMQCMRHSCSNGLETTRNLGDNGTCPCPRVPYRESDGLLTKYLQSKHG